MSFSAHGPALLRTQPCEEHQYTQTFWLGFRLTESQIRWWWILFAHLIRGKWETRGGVSACAKNGGVSCSLGLSLVLLEPFLSSCH